MALEKITKADKVEAHLIIVPKRSTDTLEFHSDNLASNDTPLTTAINIIRVGGWYFV